MKTTVLFRMMVLVAMVFAGIANACCCIEGYLQTRWLSLSSHEI